MSNKTTETEITAMSSRMKAALVILSAVLIFAAPTYLVYMLENALQLNYIVSVSLGFVLFIIGLALLYFLIKRRVIS